MTPCGKWWYRDQKEAEGRLNTMLRRPDIKLPETLNTYYCEECMGWHVGHNFKLLSVAKRAGLPRKLHDSQHRTA